MSVQTTVQQTVGAPAVPVLRGVSPQVALLLSSVKDVVSCNMNQS